MAVTINLLVEEEYSGRRLDHYLSNIDIIESRSQLKKRILAIERNGAPAKLSCLLAEGDLLSISIDDPPAMVLTPEAIALDVIYENSDVAVINKSAGMAVHPGAGRHTGTLVNALLHHIKTSGFSSSFGNLRPGIVHRLDKDTSGAIIVAKTVAAHAMLADQFSKRRARKCYLAILKGMPKVAEGSIKTYITRDSQRRKTFAVSDNRGKDAHTDYRILSLLGDYTFVALYPKTGRTHQLRVHMQHLGCPILGDVLYARTDKRFPNVHMMLHAWELSLQIPPEGKHQQFHAPLPNSFTDCLKELDCSIDQVRNVLYTASES